MKLRTSFISEIAAPPVIDCSESEYTRNQHSILSPGTSLASLLLYVTTHQLEMAHFSNSSNIINHGTLNLVQGDFHIHNKDSESGMHDFRSEEHPYR